MNAKLKLYVDKNMELNQKLIDMQKANNDLKVFFCVSEVFQVTAESVRQNYEMQIQTLSDRLIEIMHEKAKK